jgi:hypothetical protein
LNGSGVFNTDALVVNRKHVALKNLHVENAVMGPMPPEDPIIVEMHDGTRKGALYGLRFHWGTLPRTTRAFVVFEKWPTGEAVTAKEAELQRLGIRPAPDHKGLFQEAYEIGCAEPRRFDLGKVYELPVSRGGSVTFPKLFVPGDRPLTVALNVVLSEDLSGDAQFDVVQQSGQAQIIGGSTYLLRGKPLSPSP